MTLELTFGRSKRSHGIDRQRVSGRLAEASPPERWRAPSVALEPAKEERMDPQKPHRSPQPADRNETASAMRDTASGLADKLEAAITSSTEGFVKMAGTSDIYELEAAKIALQRSTSQDVKDFAHHMITDHTRTTEQLKSTLQALGNPTVPPQQLDDRHQTMLDDLNGAAQEDFDHRYIAQQQAAHSAAITLFKTYRERGEAAELRALCAQALPVLEGHLHMVEQMKARR
jgi:putative membrane protein